MLFEFKGKNIHYTDKGSGNVIVLLHGYLESAEVWNGFADELSGEFRVIAIDLPGHGMSDVYGEIHSMEFMAEAVRDLLISSGISKVFLTGHSLGGYVALAFLELYPELLSGYCLFHSQPLADTPEAIEKRLREISIVKAGKKELMYPENVRRMFADSNLVRMDREHQRSKEIASALPGEGIIAVLNGMIARPSRLALMEEGRVPCLWLLGAMDNYINCSLIQQKVKLPDNARTVILEGSGHMGFVEEPRLSVKIISDFVRGLN